MHAAEESQHHTVWATSGETTPSGSDDAVHEEQQGGPTCSADCQGPIYTVVAGDTFTRIAQKLGVSTPALIACNPGANPNRLQIGQQLCTPSAGIQCASGCQGPIYTVVAGDTFERIAVKLGVSTPALTACNPNVSPTRLQIGQQLCTPTAGVQCASGCQGPLYTVVAGDTFERIAVKLGVSTPALMACNPGVSPTRLQIGQQLCTPSAGLQCSSDCQGPVYTVVAGDTFTRIAQKIGVSTTALINCNPNVNPNNLQIGQQLCTPSRPQACPSGCNGPMHTVASGETFFTIARQLGVSLDRLLACNPGVDPANLRVGQRLCTPGTAPPSQCPVGCGGPSFTVRAGDTFFTIARQLGVSLDALLACNPGVNPDNLQIGSTLCTPD